MTCVFESTTRSGDAPTTDASRSAGAFHTHPDDVLADPSLSRDDKRALLASWLSDARGVADRPGLRRLDTGALVDVDDVFAALRSLDDDGAVTSTAPGPNRPEPPRPLTIGRAARRSPVSRLFARVTRRDDDDDPPPCPAAAARPVRFHFVDVDGARGRRASACAPRHALGAAA